MLLRVVEGQQCQLYDLQLEVFLSLLGHSLYQYQALAGTEEY